MQCGFAQHVAAFIFNTCECVICRANPMKVLVIEDESENIACLKRGTRQQHFEIELCDWIDTRLARALPA